MVSGSTTINNAAMNEDATEIVNSRLSRCRQKLLCELDWFRRQTCQGKICNFVVRAQQSSHTSEKEKLNMQEKVWLATQKKYLKEEEEICHQIHAEEEESRKRLEQMIIEKELHAKRVSEINKIILRVEEKEREKEEKNKQIILQTRALADKCHMLVMEYRNEYEKFVELLKTCRDHKSLGERNALIIAKLRNFSEIVNTRIPEKCKNMTVTEEDLHVCSKTVEEAKNIIKLVEADIEIINKKYLASIVESQTKEDKSYLKLQNVTSDSVSHSPQSLVHPVLKSSTDHREAFALKDFVNEEAYSRYKSLITFQEKFSKSYESLMKDETMKKFRFDCQKAVNTPVNAICPISAAHLQDKLTKLQRLISGSAVEMGRSHFSASQHPQGIAFCKDLLARKFVAQGETTVACKPEAAFAIAAVIVTLWSEFPDLGQLILAHFIKECPYLVPYFKPRLIDQSDVEYYKSLGYRYSENGDVEKQDKFLKRMSGIMHLYCAVIISPMKRHSRKLHPVGLKESWRWLACLINLDPRPDICATLLYEFLEVVGHFMYINYGQIFQKVLHLLCTEYYHKMEEVTPKALRGPVARLESFLQKILKQGMINPPAGLLPNDFW